MKLLAIIVAILSSLFTKLETQGLQSDFSATEYERPGEVMHYSGTFVLLGRQFLFTMDNTRAAYDGKTMYMYSPQTEELTLTEPSEEELMESNPFLFAQGIVDLCSVTEKSSPDGLHTIVRLVPNDPEVGVSQFTLKVRNADLMPMELEVREGQKNSVVKLINPSFLSEKPAFVIEPSETTFVNDLRF